MGTGHNHSVGAHDKTGPAPLLNFSFDRKTRGGGRLLGRQHAASGSLLQILVEIAHDFEVVIVLRVGLRLVLHQCPRDRSCGKCRWSGCGRGRSGLRAARRASRLARRDHDPLSQSRWSRSRSLDIATGRERGDPGGCRRSSRGRGGHNGLWLGDGDDIGTSARQQQNDSDDHTDGQYTNRGTNGPAGDSARRASSTSGTRARPSFLKIVLEFLSSWPPRRKLRLLKQQHVALGASRVSGKNSIILELEFHSTARALNNLLTHDDSNSERRDDEIVQAYAIGTG